jgi:hypothetical protein
MGHHGFCAAATDLREGRLLLRVGRHFAFAEEPPPDGEAWQGGFGHGSIRQGAAGKEEWVIEVCTLPHREGQLLPPAAYADLGLDLAKAPQGYVIKDEVGTPRSSPRLAPAVAPDVLGAM